MPPVLPWRHSLLSRHITSSEVERVIEVCNPATRLGLREGAVIMMLAHLGLRAGEVIRMKLDDIDWFEGHLTSVGSIVRHCLLRGGLDAPTYGAHQFRHGLATELLRQGASLGEIGELLGHRSPQTNKFYIKVDLDALRTLALPWPGGVQ